jgi:hypothetical protein
MEEISFHDFMSGFRVYSPRLMRRKATLPVNRAKRYAADWKSNTTHSGKSKVSDLRQRMEIFS